MTSSDDPKLNDLKKLLRRLEKIDPDQRRVRTRANGPPPVPERTNSIKPATGNALRLRQAVENREPSRTEPTDGLLRLQDRQAGVNASRLASDGPDLPVPDLPAIVKRKLPVATEQVGEPLAGPPSTMRTVLIASVTAAIVSGLATAATIIWMNGGFNQLAAPRQAAAPTAPTNAPDNASAAASATATSKPTEPAALPQPTRTAAATIPQPTAEHTSQSEPAAQSAPTPAGEQIGAAESDHTVEPASPAKPLDEITPPKPQPAKQPSAGRDPQAISQKPLIRLDPAQRPALIAAAPPGKAEAIATSNRPSVQAVPATPVAPTAVVETARNVAEPSAATQPATPAPATIAAASPAQSPIAPSRQITFLGASDTTQLPTVPALDAVETGAVAVATDAGRPTKVAVATIDESELRSQPASDAAGSGEGEAEAARTAALIDAPAQVEPPAVPTLVHPDELNIKAGEAFKFPLKVDGPAARSKDHYIIVSGLKRGTRPTHGIELMFDTWRIDEADLEQLELAVPAGFARRLRLAVELRRADGTTRQKSEIVLKMAGGADRITAGESESASLPQAVRRQVDEGEVQVDNGHLPSARVLFRRAANAGSKSAALLLAGSYDPSFIDLYSTTSPPQPDVDLARRWYRRAIELGSQVAARRLAQLPTQ
ncbi:MAG: hypothetical protein K0U74_07545 [Alphaproteobacteria bacterium]|nr:hypothetical protein [Alphaproteobacteria bacterium]